MNKRCVIILAKSFVLTVCIFSLLWHPSIAKETNSLTIMNAFLGLQLEGYSGEVFRNKLKGIIDGKIEFKGNEWEEFLLRVKEKGNNPKISIGAKGILDLTAVFILNIAVYQLGKISSEDFATLKFSKEERPKGEYNFVIPKDVRRSQKYLKSAIEILEQNRNLFEGWTDSEDFEKLFANLSRSIDLYKEAQENYIAYFELVNNDFRNRKKYLGIYKKENDEYALESKKIDIYITQKMNELFKKYNYGKSIDFNSSAEETVRALMKMEKEYEKKY